MRIGKRSPLLLGAIMAIALALPAVASASEWTSEGEPILEEQPIELDGTYSYSVNGIGSFVCTIHGEATLVPGDEGEISNLAASNPCKGSFFGCEVELLFETPWPLEARAEDVLVNDLGERWRLCPPSYPGEVTVEGDIELTPDNPAAISSFGLYGFMEDTKTHLPLVVTGELEVSPAGVYGFE